MRRIMAGVYVDAAGMMHIDLGELLRSSDYPDTPENREILSRAAEEVIRKEWPGTEIVYASPVGGA